MLLNLLELSIFMYIYQFVCIINYYYCWLINLVYCWYLKVFQNQILFVTLYDFNNNNTTVLYRFYDLLNLRNNNQFFKRTNFTSIESLSNDFMYEVTWVNNTTKRTIMNPTTVYDIDGVDFMDFRTKFIYIATSDSTAQLRRRFNSVLTVTIGDYDLTSIFKEVCDSFKIGMKVFDFTRYAVLRTRRCMPEASTMSSLHTDALEIIDDDILETHTFKANQQLIDIHF